MDNVTYRIGRGPQASRQGSLPARTATARLGGLVDRITGITWGVLAMSALLAPYLALKPATNFWWWP